MSSWPVTLQDGGLPKRQLSVRDMMLPVQEASRGLHHVGLTSTTLSMKTPKPTGQAPHLPWPEVISEWLQTVRITAVRHRHCHPAKKADIRDVFQRLGAVLTGTEPALAAEGINFRCRTLSQRRLHPRTRQPDLEMRVKAPRSAVAVPVPSADGSSFPTGCAEVEVGYS